MRASSLVPVLIGFTLIFSSARRIEGAEILAGIALADITPPIGGETTGYSAAKPTDGIHDNVSARVLVLRSPQQTIALVSLDLCVFNSPWLHEQMPKIGIDQLLVLNTHTHAGPNLNQNDFPSAEKPWRRTVEERVLAAITQAQQQLFPAYFSASEGNLQLGYNRLVIQGDYAVTHFENPDHIPYGAVDPTVGVIRITDDQSKVRAVLVHYACHPVILGPRNRKISADYPGVMRQVVEKSLDQGAMCIFLQGCGGDINPLVMARGESRDGDFDLVDRAGQLLATEVLRLLTLLKDQPGASDELRSTSSQITVKNRWKPQEELTLGVSSLLLNRSIGIITLPGEPFHRFQVDFRDKAGLPHAFVWGYCCNGPYDWPSYMPDVVSAARGGYGASDTTRTEVGTGERLLNQGLVQLFTLQDRLKSAPQRHVFEEKK